MVGSLILQVTAEGHKWAAGVEYSLELLKVMWRICFRHFNFDVLLTLIHSDNEVNHDTVNSKVTKDNRYVAELRSILDQII